MCAPQKARVDLVPFEIASGWDLFRPIALITSLIAVPLLFALLRYTPAPSEAALLERRAAEHAARLDAEVDCDGVSGDTCTPAQAAAALLRKKERELRRVRERVVGPERSVTIHASHRNTLTDAFRDLLNPPIDKRCARDHAGGRQVRGWMKVLADLSATGEVLGIRIEESTLDNDAVGKCIENELATTRFAATGEPRTERFTYAFAL